MIHLTPHSGRPGGAGKEKTELELLEALLTQMKSIRIEARRLTRSGHPGVQAQGLKALAQAEDNIRWLKEELARAEEAQ